MTTYHDYLRFILAEGVPSNDRTGTGTTSAFGYEMRFPLRQGFPLVTTKKVSFKSVASELLWMLSGSTNVKDLHAMGNHIWDPWAGKDGEFGPIYGKQWVAWQGHFGRTINQIEEAVRLIREDPYSRRIIVNAWNVTDLPKMALPPCHMLFQFRVHDTFDHLRIYSAAKDIDDAKRVDQDRLDAIARLTSNQVAMTQVTREIIAAYGDAIDVSTYRRRRLSCRMDIRSSDAFIGMPYNIAQYALLTHLMAHQTGLDVGDLVIHVGDGHIYNNHIEQVIEILGREPAELPRLKLHHLPDSIFEYRLDDMEVLGYEPAVRIDAPIAV